MLKSFYVRLYSVLLRLETAQEIKVKFTYKSWLLPSKGETLQSVKPDLLLRIWNDVTGSHSSVNAHSAVWEQLPDRNPFGFWLFPTC